jgi:dTDP-4-dehydrorhamnose 3,5-epimerase-like enzyme
MAKILHLPTHVDSRGKLTVIEKVLPFEIKRVYYIYDCSDVERGGHRHAKNAQALACVKGSCEIEWSDGRDSGIVILDSPSILLVVMPEDFHTMRKFSEDAVLLVLASEYFDPDDYIDEGHQS